MNKLEKTIVATACLISLSFISYAGNAAFNTFAENYRSPTANSFGDLADKIHAAHCGGNYKPADCGNAAYADYLNP